MAAVTAQNVVQVDDRNGSHYWIFRAFHVNGAHSEITVDESCVGAAFVPTTLTGSATVTVINSSDTDSIRLVRIDTGEATGWKTIIARFGGTAGSGSSKGVL